MKAASITPTTSDNARLRGIALASVIIALMLSLFLEALDQTIVGTAMPRIIAQLHSLDRYTWVVTAYVLASMTMIPIVGKLSDQFGRKWFLLGGTGLFLLGSLLAGASQTMDQLILFRALQGLGAGIGMALVATVVGDLFPPDERAKWSSLFGIVYGVSNLFGPTLGGWLVEHGPLVGSLVSESSRWRWVFYINLPVGILAVLALLFFLPANLSLRTGQGAGWAAVRRIDVLGAVISVVATICLMLGLTWGSSQTFAWSSLQVLGLLAISIVLFALFLLAERKAREPILPLNLFRNQVFSVAALLTMLQMMVLLGLSLYLPLFLQGVLAVSPTLAGMVMTPLSLSMVLGAMLAGPLIGALKRSQLILILGALLMAAGSSLLTLMTPATGFVQAILSMVLVGIGTGSFFALGPVAQNAVPLSQLGVSTAATRYLGQLGATLGIAIVGTVVNSAVSGSLTQHLPNDQAGKLLLARAIQHGFVAVLIFAVIALLATFFLKDVPFVWNLSFFLTLRFVRNPFALIMKNSRTVADNERETERKSIMKYARLYADKSGNSHFEDVEVELSPVDFAPPAPPMDVASFMPATQVGVIGAPAGWFGSLHPAPRRIFFFYLTGVTEIAASDGEVRRFVAGSILLVEDTFGKGHTTRIAGNEYATAMLVQVG